MAMPETDLLRIGRWCRERVPEHLWDQVRVEAEIADRHVTIIETRPPWDGQGDGRGSRSRACDTPSRPASGASTGVTGT